MIRSADVLEAQWRFAALAGTCPAAAAREVISLSQPEFDRREQLIARREASAAAAEAANAARGAELDVRGAKLAAGEADLQARLAAYLKAARYDGP